jgi:lipopolysaccharide transport system permease protein
MTVESEAAAQQEETGAIGQRSSPGAQELWPSYVVEPPRRWEALDLGELWRYRELLYFLTWRDIKVRYKQTVIGAAWAILQPLLAMLAFSVIFGRLIGVPSDGVPYPVFSYIALVPWTFFATAVSRSAASLVTDAHLISKVYFPRLVVPVSAVLAMAVDLAIASVIVLGMLVFYAIAPGVTVLSLPLVFLLLVVTTLGPGLWLSALNVKYRDVAHVIPFLMQFWLFLTPVAYPSSIVPEPWRAVYALNPMVGVVEGFRWALLGTADLSPQIELLSAVSATVIFASGLLYFHRTEDEFADVV